MSFCSFWILCLTHILSIQKIINLKMFRRLEGETSLCTSFLCNCAQPLPQLWDLGGGAQWPCRGWGSPSPTSWPPNWLWQKMWSFSSGSVALPILIVTIQVANHESKQRPFQKPIVYQNVKLHEKLRFKKKTSFVKIHLGWTELCALLGYVSGLWG